VRKTICAAAIAASVITMAGCSIGGTPGNVQPTFKRIGPTITLHLDLYGSPGYEAADLYASYERLHPNIQIVQDVTTSESAYWQTLSGELATGHGLGDLVAIPLDQSYALTHTLSTDFVPLNTLGGIAPGVNVFEDSWLPWVWPEATTSTSQTLGIGAEIEPLAMCFQPGLLTQAGISVGSLVNSWKTWQGYLGVGEQYRAKSPNGPPYTASPAALYEAMIGQAREQYYSATGAMVLGHSQAVSSAWATTVQAIQDGLTAGSGGSGGSAGSGGGMPVSMPCSPSTLSQLHGQWNLIASPGGAGDLGGFFLAIPRTSPQQSAAFQLAQYLTSTGAVSLYQSQYKFPSNLTAINAVLAAASDPAVTKIFFQAADEAPQPLYGPATDALGQDITGALAQVQGHAESAAAAWQTIVTTAARTG
jgi:cellobiose transport system substrate-binding protein